LVVEAAHRQHAHAGEARVAEGTFGSDPGHFGYSGEDLFNGLHEAQGGVGASLFEIDSRFDDVGTGLPEPDDPLAYAARRFSSMRFFAS
jgi:hypothetical protein